MSTFDVFTHWDAETGVWVAHSDALPGLVAEAATWDVLKEKLAALASELVELNNVPLDGEGGQLRLVTEETIPVAA
jgi:predicted RNase H-like HicB family nuclease